MRKLLIACASLTLVFAVQAAAADRPGGFDRTGCVADQSPPREDIELWCQPTNCSGAFASNVDLGTFGVDTESIDDFTASSYYAVTSMAWWGVRVYDLDIEFFLVTVYRDNGNCGPDESDIVSEQTIIDFDEQPTECGYYYSYEALLDPVVMEPGGHYWLCIRAALVADPEDVYSEWYWAMHDTDVLCPALYRSDFSGFPDWIAPNTAQPGYSPADAMAFCLYTDGLVANERKTLGDVKKLYR